MPEVEQIEPDYWKYHPRKQLLAESDQRMTARAFGAYWWICNKLMIERLPGVIKWDEGRLMEWGRLSAAEWKKDLHLILPAFEFHEATNTLHHPTIKSGYAEQYRQVMTHRAFGKIGAAKRYDKSKKSPPTIPPIASPYASYKEPIIRIAAENLAQVLEKAREYTSRIASPCPPYSNVCMKDIQHSGAPPQLAVATAASPQPPTPNGHPSSEAHTPKQNTTALAALASINRS